jgi:nitroreductase
MKKAGFSPLSDYREYPPEEMEAKAIGFLAEMKRRRSVRHFSDHPVSRKVIEDCLRAANTAPSGANRQPWHFVVVDDEETKSRLREAAEKEEQEFYERRAPEEWLEALRPLGTDQHKPFLETAPYLIAIFAQLHGVDVDGQSFKHYYVNESVGIATGMLITALHLAGLATLTHTPSPMRFLNEILDRPGHERPYLLLVVGYPAEDAVVPDLEKKPLREVCTFI